MNSITMQQLLDNLYVHELRKIDKEHMEFLPNHRCTIRYGINVNSCRGMRCNNCEPDFCLNKKVSEFKYESNRFHKSSIESSKRFLVEGNF